jgi:hypothetical protein
LRPLLESWVDDTSEKMKGNGGNLYQLFLFCRALDMVDALEKFMVAK